MKIRTLTPQDKPSAKALWQQVFVEDTASFIDFYFTQEYDHDTYYGVFIQDTLVSMAGVTACGIRYHHQTKETYLFRGVATDPAHTQKGYATKLMKYILNALRESGVEIVFLKTFIHPFYKRMGFSTCSHVQEESIAPTALPDNYICTTHHKMEQVPAPTLAALYTLYIDFIADKNLFIQRKKTDFQRTLHESLDISQEHALVLYRNTTPVAYALCERRKNSLYAHEVVYTHPSELQYFAQAAKREYQAEFIYKNVLADGAGQKIPDAMCRVLHPAALLPDLQVSQPITLSLYDAMFQDNAGVWQLAPDSVPVKVDPQIATAPDSTANTGQLGAWLLGEVGEAAILQSHLLQNQLAHGIFEQY